MMINCSDKHKIKIGCVINARRGGAVERPQACVWVCVRVFVCVVVFAKFPNCEVSNLSLAH